MGKFSDYVGSINEQTNILRENLTNATGVDCSKKSIGMCADVVADYVPDLEKEEVYYDRPSWYPDIKTILNSAPEIEKDGVTYVPAWIVLLNNLYTETPFYKTHSTTSTALNYYKSTGGDAVLCSDKCDNDINNASSETLEVGTTILHTWDTSKDIADPSGQDLNKVRWSIIYQSQSLNLSAVTLHIWGWNDCLEAITGNIRFGEQIFAGITNKRGGPIEYIEIQKNTKISSISSGSFAGLYNLKVLIIDCNFDTLITSFPYCDSLKYLKLPICNIRQQLSNALYSLKKIDFEQGTIGSNSTSNFLGTAYNLKKITIPKNFSTSFSGFNNAYALKEIVFEDGNTIVSETSAAAFCDSAISLTNLVLPQDSTKLILLSGLSRAYNLKYVKIPSSIETLQIGTYPFGYTTYIELFNDFNISAVNFAGQIPKDLQWLRDLCGWLKDRTGDTANTMIIGSENLQNAQNLWLTFNPDNKRDITWVDAGTEGAINIVEFITTQLNWTLS